VYADTLEGSYETRGWAGVWRSLLHSVFS
jgi:hypothetical protein